MVDVIIMLALGFVIVATFAAVATTSASQWESNRCTGLGGVDRMVLLLAAGVVSPPP